MTTPLAQPDFDFNIESPDWLAMKFLIEKVAQDVAQRRKHLLVRMSNWLMGLELFRKFEEDKMILSEPSSRDREFHRATLTGLMGTGEMLLLDLNKQTEIDPKNIGIQVADFQACIIELRDSYAMWYHDMTDARQKQIMQEVFGVPL